LGRGGGVTGMTAVWSGGETETSGAWAGAGSASSTGGSRFVTVAACAGNACGAGAVWASEGDWPRTTSMPPGTAVAGEGGVATASRISTANRAAWLAIDKASGSLILSTASAPGAVARSAQEYRNRCNFAAASASRGTRIGMWQILTCRTIVKIARRLGIGDAAGSVIEETDHARDLQTRGCYRRIGDHVVGKRPLRSRD